MASTQLRFGRWLSAATRGGLAWFVGLKPLQRAPQSVNSKPFSSAPGTRTLSVERR